MKIAAGALAALAVAGMIVIAVAEGSQHHSNAMGALALLLCIVAVVVMIVLGVTLGGRNNPRRAPGRMQAAGNVPAANVPAANVPAANVPAANVPAANVPAANVPAANVAVNTEPEHMVSADSSGTLPSTSDAGSDQISHPEDHEEQDQHGVSQ